NYHRDEPETMLDLYERVLPGDPASRWTFSWVPDVVVVNLGTKDFAVAGAPSPAAFEAGYVRLLAMIRRHAPEAFILCTVGNMLVGRDLARARAGIHGAVEAFVRHGGGPVEAFDMKVSNARPGAIGTLGVTPIDAWPRCSSRSYAPAIDRGPNRSSPRAVTSSAVRRSTTKRADLDELLTGSAIVLLGAVLGLRGPRRFAEAIRSDPTAGALERLAGEE